MQCRHSHAGMMPCAVRERMIGFLAHRHPQALPRLRAEIAREGDAAASRPRARDADVPSSPRAEDVDTSADDVPAGPGR